MSSFYRPDNWVVLKFSGDDPHYRVLAGWSGSYLSGNTWRMNSIITKVEEDEFFFYFYGSSGSRYHCSKDAYMLRMNTAPVWNALKQAGPDKVEMMPEDTDWMNTDWIIEDA
jgi:hypothetical protein